MTNAFARRGDWDIQGDTRDMHTVRKGHVKTKKEDLPASQGEKLQDKQNLPRG
jgi:hypothetical protein